MMSVRPKGGVRGGSSSAAGRGTSIRMAAALALLAGLIVAGGCARGPALVALEDQKAIDRTFVEYPAGFELRPLVRNLTAPNSIAFDNEGSILIAESGIAGQEPRIFGYKADGAFFQIYPAGRRIPF